MSLTEDDLRNAFDRLPAGFASQPRILIVPPLVWAKALHWPRPASSVKSPRRPQPHPDPGIWKGVALGARVVTAKMMEIDE